ncbi:hypothetical protein [Botrimarina hoheduenensis]|uniref:Uncharacterized protein n=1 Tax=Botrimarina hoheduenensis TaxID=2528000 RepID=A0A5C5VYF0_9BACT|nr:hypothetical protein [Botrimarina hoheduenensis]TWT42769.1 hypothetical protein Pla111_27420 [Botrimarina hoheduenensis]
MHFYDQSTIRAVNNARFYARFKWLGLGALAFGLWSLYDGYVNYPDMKVRSDAIMVIAEDELSRSELLECQDGAHDLNDVYKRVVEKLRDQSDAWARWLAIAEEKSWPVEPPEKAHTDNDIIMQYVMAGLCTLATTYFFGVLISTNGRWIEVDDNELITSGGLSFPLAAVTQIDKRKWIDKGIAYVAYNDNDRQRRFVLDNYKYLREETDAILYRMEQVAGADKIINGSAEVHPDAEK